MSFGGGIIIKSLQLWWGTGLGNLLPPSPPPCTEKGEDDWLNPGEKVKEAPR